MAALVIADSALLKILMATKSFGAFSTSVFSVAVVSFTSVMLSIFPLSISLGLTDYNNYIKPFRFESDGHNANNIETGRIRKTTGIIIEISALPAAVII